MAVNKDLAEFVEKSLGKGLSRTEIKGALDAAGWEKEEVTQAISAFHEIEFPVPVPSKQFSLAAKDTVFYLFLFVTLHLASFGLVFLAFNIIELQMPYPTDYGSVESLEGSVRYWLAWSVVFVPVYLFVAWRAEEKRKLTSNCGMPTGRQWLTYFALFTATMTVLGDLIALVLAFLSGDVTQRLALKVAVVLIIAGAVIAYYYRDIKLAEAGLEASDEG